MVGVNGSRAIRTSHGRKIMDNCCFDGPWCDISNEKRRIYFYHPPEREKMLKITIENP